MHHEYSLAYLTVFGLAPPDMVTTAAHAGYDCVSLRLHPVTAEEPAFPLAHDRALLRQTKESLRESGIGVLDVELVRLTPDFAAESYDALLDVSAELGARHVLAQAADSNTARATDHLIQLCDAAKTRGLTVDVEFVTWTETPDLARAAEIVRGADRGNAGLLVDTLHFSRSRCSIADLAMLPRSWFHFAQVCDAPARSPATTDGLIFAARNERLFLGEGGLELRGILEALPPDIPYSIEIPRVSLSCKVGLEECARRALATARQFVEGIEAAPRAAWPSSHSPTHSGRSA